MGIRLVKPDRPVYIEFTRSTKKFAPLSWLIRKVQGTEYSHVRLRWQKTNGVTLVYEASGNSVKFVGTLRQKELEAEVVKSYKFTVNKQQHSDLVDTCIYYADVKYSIYQVINIGILQLFGIRLFKNNNEYSQVCSELVARVVEKVLSVDLGLDPDLAGPKEIDIALSKQDKIQGVE